MHAKISVGNLKGRELSRHTVVTVG